MGVPLIAFTSFLTNLNIGSAKNFRHATMRVKEGGLSRSDAFYQGFSNWPEEVEKKNKVNDGSYDKAAKMIEEGVWDQMTGIWSFGDGSR